MIVLGDVATLGPNPREVIEILSASDAVFINGNHDEILVDIFEHPDVTIHPDAYKWAASQISGNHIAFLKRFARSSSILLSPKTKLIAYHASPWSNSISLREHIRSPEGRKILDECEFDIFVGGHEHQQFKENIGQKQIISVGSAGFPYKKVPFHGFPEAHGWSEYAILEHRRGITDVIFKRVEYDIAAFHAAAKRSDNPIKEWCLSIPRNHQN